MSYHNVLSFQRLWLGQAPVFFLAAQLHSRGTATPDPKHACTLIRARRCSCGPTVSGLLGVSQQGETRRCDALRSSHCVYSRWRLALALTCLTSPTLVRKS